MILALDPGGTTGYAYRIIGAFGCGQVQQDRVWGLLTELEPTTLICERFLQSQRMIDLEAAEVIGIVKEWARQNKDKTQLEFQMAAQVTHFFTNDRLKEHEVYTPGMRHANDAARHLLYFEMFGKGALK